MKAHILVTGGAGFIGSHAVDALVAAGAQVTVLDDLRTGDKANLAGIEATLVEGDCGDAAVLDAVLPGVDAVWHLAADPEVRRGADDPTTSIHSNVDTTVALLEGMRRHGIPKILFTSTSTVYGSADVRPTPESFGPLLPISIYGGAKLAGEALISAYAHTFGMDATLFRFANVVGPRAAHGVTFDFIRKLQATPERLEILGDGTQTKSYVSVADTVAGLLHGYQHAGPGVHAFNVGSDDAIPVMRIAEIVADEMGLKPEFATTGGTSDGAGWKGDVKHMALANDALKALGWEPMHSSEDAVRIAARSLLDAAS